jgi:hypothetical protein
MQIIGDDDPVISITKWPRRTGLEVDPSDFAVWPGERQKSGDIAVDGAYLIAAIAQQARMPTVAGRQIEHETARRDQRREPPHPWGRRGGIRRNFSVCGHYRQTVGQAHKAAVQLPARRWAR